MDTVIIPVIPSPDPSVILVISGNQECTMWRSYDSNQAPVFRVISFKLPQTTKSKLNNELQPTIEYLSALRTNIHTLYIGKNAPVV